MTPPRGPLFLERQVYRRRRLIDAARVVPVAGLVALLLPALWSSGQEMSTAAEAVYLFGLWFLLILAAALLSRPLRDAQTREQRHGDSPTPPGAGSGAGSGSGSEPTQALPGTGEGHAP